MTDLNQLCLAPDPTTTATAAHHLLVTFKLATEKANPSTSSAFHSASPYPRPTSSVPKQFDFRFRPG